MGLFDDWQAQKDSQYILAVDYLEQLAKQHDSTIEATASYLMLTKDMKIYERLSTGEYVEPYHDFNNPPPIIEFFDNAKAVYRANGEFTQFFYFETGSLYFKKSELPAIEPLASNEVRMDKVRPLNSLASFVTSYNLPQVAALILGISFEYVDVTPSRAYINENDFPYEWAVKFDKLLASLVAMAKQGQLKGLVIAYYEPFSFQNTYTSTLPTQPKKEFDYLNTVIDKASLETYLKSIGKDLTQLLELQEPLTIATPQTDSQLSQQVGGQQLTIESQAKEIADLKVQLASAAETINQQVERIAELETKLNESQKSTSDKDVLSDRSRAGHLITIALLVDIIKTTPQGFDKRGNPLPPKYASQNKLYEKIEEYGVKGQSAKTLETRFADANKELEDIKPNHKFT